MRLHRIRCHACTGYTWATRMSVEIGAVGWRIPREGVVEFIYADDAAIWEAA